MITRMGMAPRRKGMDAETFQAHWRGRHGDLAARLPGVQRYWQNHALLRDGEPLLPWTGFDACAEIDFPSIPVMQEAFRTTLYLDEIREDEAYLLEKSQGGMVLGDRTVVRAPPGADRLTRGSPHPGGFRLLTFMRAAPQKSGADLAAGLQGQSGAREAIGREILASRLPAEAGGHVSIFDAVEIHWFADAGRAERYLSSAEAREHRAEICHLVRGVERLLAEVRVIV